MNIKNLYLWLLIAAVLMFCVQILAVIVYIYSFISLVWDDPLLKGVEPERETLFYAIFLLTSVVLTVACSIGLQVFFIAWVALLLYIPTPQDVAALALAWDQWNHLDAVTGWFIKHGWYINYEQTVQIMVITAMLYITGLFYFIRLWL